MNKKLISAIAVASATILACTPVFAATSSTTTNTDTTTTSAPAVTVSSKTAATIKNGVAVPTSDGARFTGNSSEMTDKTVATTVQMVKPAAESNKAVTPAEQPAVNLMQFVKSTGETFTKAYGPYKIAMYKAGVSVWDGFGTFTATVGVGNAYEGKTVVIYAIHKDGSITSTELTVTNGKIAVPLTEACTFTAVIK